jgi:hypothetical protein
MLYPPLPLHACDRKWMDFSFLLAPFQPRLPQAIAYFATLWRRPWFLALQCNASKFCAPIASCRRSHVAARVQCTRCTHRAARRCLSPLKWCSRSSCKIQLDPRYEAGIGGAGLALCNFFIPVIVYTEYTQ